MKKYKENYDNGKVKVEGFIEEELRCGDWIYYYEDGQMEKEVHYDNGKENGKFFRWYRNGNLEIESEYVEGKNIGLWKEYYENGKIKEIGKYDDEHQYWPIDFWDEHGNQLMKNGTGKKIEKFGASELDVYEQYYENGIFVKEFKIGIVRYGDFISDVDADDKTD